MIKVWHVAIAVIIFFSGASWLVDDRVLVQRQEDLQKNIGDPLVNKQLYDYIRYMNGDCVIMTDHQMIEYLPGLEEHHLIIDMSDEKFFYGSLQNKKVTSVLVSSTAPAYVYEHLQKKVDEGEYIYYFYINGWHFVGTNRK